jgi:Prenyltransferase and squalene oxidase repeat
MAMRLLALVILLIAPVFGQDPAPRRTSFQGAVNASVERGVAWLRAQQQKDGHWKDGHSATYPTGVTALCALALLRSDVAPDDPAISKALEALKYLPIDKTYSTGLLLMVLEAAKGQERHADWAKRATDFLVKTQSATGLWAYPEGDPDLSNSQFAAFGLYASTRMGVPVPRETFVRFSNRVLSMQGTDGGFSYTTHDLVSGSMTGAGIASLLLCRQLDQKQKLGLRAKEIDAACERGFAWLAKRFRADRNPSGPADAYHPNPAFYFYYLYAVERAAILGGKPRLGDHDWYREGAIKLIRKQDASGHWLDVVNTSFALLFLKRASLTYSPHAKEFEGDPKALLPIDEEAPADAALAALKITGTVPFLRDWVVLGPFPNFEDKLFNEDLIDEAKILPFPTLRTGKLEWKEWRSEKDFVDLDLAISQAGNVLGYAACYLWSDADRDAVLWFGSDEGAKVLLNREAVLSEHRHDQTGADASRVRVKLKKGRNVLIVKVEELKFYWGFHARLTDPEARALPLKTSIRPEKPEK